MLLHPRHTPEPASTSDLDASKRLVAAAAAVRESTSCSANSAPAAVIFTLSSAQAIADPN